MTSKEEREIEITREKWKSRRAMAWVSLITIIVVTVLFMFKIPMEKLDKLSDALSWLFISLTSIIGAYIGFASFPEISNVFKKRK